MPVRAYRCWQRNADRRHWIGSAQRQAACEP